MKLHLPLPLLIFLLGSAPFVAVAAQAIYDGTSFWIAAKTTVEELSELVIHADISPSGASDITVNGDLTVTSPESAPHSLSLDTKEGAFIVGSGGSASFTGLHDVSFSGTTMGSKKGGNTASQTTSSWPVTGGVYVGEGASLSASGNSGSVSSCGNGFSSTSSSSTGSGGAAYFVAKYGTLDLSHNAGGVNISDNTVTVNASGTEAYGAVYASEGSTVTMVGNASVTLNNNSITNVLRSACGAALYAQYAPVTISGTTGMVDISNNTARTTARSQECYSGAIGMAGAKSVLSITDNGAVRVSGNSSIAEGTSANAGGGAFRLDCGMEMTGNGSVLFENNLAQSATYQAKGGAIKTAYSSTAAVNISRNGSVSFIGNSAVGLSTANQNRYGGAIYADMNLILADNGEVLFSGNSARSGSTTVNSYNGTGGAIKANMSILISGNDSVLFEKNFEQRGSNVMLRSIYQSSAVAGLQLQLSAKEGSSITFRDAVYSDLTAATSRAVFNGSYDKTSGTYTQTGSGDVIFSGATTRADLNAVKSSLGLGNATSKEVSDSLRSSISSESAVLGGSLRVEDEAVLELSKNLTVFGGATLSLSRGGYVDEAKDLIVQSGGTLSFCEAGELSAGSVTMGENSALLLAGASNIITANSFSMGAGSVVSITLNEAQLDDLAALTLVDVDVSEPLLSGITLELNGFGQLSSGSYKLFTIWGTEEIDTYDTSGFTLRGEGVDAGAFRWDVAEQTLFYDYVAAAADIIVDNSTEDLVIETPTAGNLIVRDNQTATLNSALEAGGTAMGNLIIEHGTAAIGAGGSLSGKVIFAADADESARTLVLATDTTLTAVELQAATGNTIHVEADSATVLNLSGSGALDKTGSGALVLSGSESRVQGELAVESGRVQLQEGASVKGESILLGSRGRAAVTAEILTDTMSITPVDGIGSILNNADITSDSTALGGAAELPAQFDNILVRLTQETAYTLNDAVLNGSHVELTESGATLQAANLVMDSTSALLAAEGVDITLSGDNTLVVGAAAGGSALHQGLTFELHSSEQLDGVTLAAGSHLTLDLSELLPGASPYVALFFKGLDSAAGDSALAPSSAYRLLETAQADSGLTLYMEQVPEPATPALFLCALGGLARRRRRG